MEGSNRQKRKKRGAWVRFRGAFHCNVAALIPRLLPVLAVSPISANLRLTQRCLARCQSCSHWLNKDTRELNTSEWKRIISGLIESGLLSVSFTGGDILLRDDLIELMRFCTSAGVIVNVTMNGYTMTEDLALDLMQSNLSCIDLSLDDLGESSDDLRGMKKSAAKVTDAFRMLKRNTNGITQLGVAFTIMKSTLESIRDVTCFALENQLAIRYNLIHFTHYFTETPFSRDQYVMNLQELEELKETLTWLAGLRPKYPHLLPRPAHLNWILSYFMDYHQRSTPCFKPMLKVCVDPNGDISPCCSQQPVGSLVHHGIRDVASSQAFLDVVRKGLTKECPGCSCHYVMSLNASLVVRLREVFLPGRIRNPRLLRVLGQPFSDVARHT
jgi:MoaA/NifB/PqqE/SkfB family radical SAM enzyme